LDDSIELEKLVNK